MKNLLVIIFSIVFIVMANAQNSWSSKASFGGSARSGAVGFMLNGKGYIGTGTGFISYYSDFWEWDPVTNTWAQKANFTGGARESAIGFAIGSKGYVGTGADGPGWAYNKNDFWEYDPVGNTWTQKTNYAGGPIRDAVAFSVGGKGYVGTGTTSSNTFSNSFYEFDPVNNSWTQKANFGGSSRASAVGFAINSKGYVGTGNDGAVKQDFWEYDPTNDLWSQKLSLPGSARKDAAGFSIGAFGFIGAGCTANSFTCFQDFWEYNQLLNTWTQRTNCVLACFGSVGFASATKGYYGTGGHGSSTFYQDFAEYTPVSTVDVEENLSSCSSRVYPNPFMSNCFIVLAAPLKSNCTLFLYDPYGRTVQRLYLQGGIQRAEIDGTSLSDGIFYYSIRNNDDEEITYGKIVHLNSGR